MIDFDKSSIKITRSKNHTSILYKSCEMCCMLNFDLIFSELDSKSLSLLSILQQF